jgi:hypothetical protein
MMKTVINNASPMITVLGGTCWVPTAVRAREKTMMILKKEVTEIRKNGIREMRARERISWMLLLNWGEAMRSRRSMRAARGEGACAKAGAAVSSKQ